MAHFVIDGLIGSSPAGQVDDTARHPLGLTLDFVDSVLGGAKFIYLKGVVNTVVGSLVTWEVAETNPTYQTALAVATANGGQQFAVASAAIVAGKFGWYQLTGVAIVATNGTLTAGADPYVSTTAGQITTTSAAGKAINNMRSRTATGTPAANQCMAQFAFPFGEAIVA